MQSLRPTVILPLENLLISSDIIRHKILRLEKRIGSRFNSYWGYPLVQCRFRNGIYFVS